MTSPLAASTEAAPTDQTLQRELTEITAAILLVASGRSLRVTLVNLRHAGDAARALDSLAAAQLVRLSVRPRGDGSRFDLTVVGV